MHSSLRSSFWIPHIQVQVGVFVRISTIPDASLKRIIKSGRAGEEAGVAPSRGNGFVAGETTDFHSSDLDIGLLFNGRMTGEGVTCFLIDDLGNITAVGRVFIAEVGLSCPE